jgi:signal transduction histidine kinase
MTTARMRLVVLAAVLCGAASFAIVLSSDHEAAQTAWARLWPLVGLSFIGTGLYATRLRPDSRVGVLMVFQGFAWFLSALALTNSPGLFSFALVAGGVWGGVFLQLIVSFPSGRLAPGPDRAIVWAGYVLFTVATIPVMLFAGPHEFGCDECPENVLLVHHDPDLANAGLGLLAVLYGVLFVIVLVRLALRWRRTAPLERLQLTPVYLCGLLAFLLVTASNAGAGDAAWWAAFATTALLPLAFLGGLVRSHVAALVEELRASRSRLVTAADTERRRLERDLHDGAQARLVGLGLVLRKLQRSLPRDAQALSPALDSAVDEVAHAIGDLRTIAAGVRPPRLDDGLAAALAELARTTPVPVEVEATRERAPSHIEAAAYFVACEAITNAVKHAAPTRVRVRAERHADRLRLLVSDDGVGGARREAGSGLLGLEDRVAAQGGSLAIHSVAGAGTRIEAEFPCAS